MAAGGIETACCKGRQAKPNQPLVDEMEKAALQVPVLGDYPIAFKNWIVFADCMMAPELEWPGVYALAIFHGVAPRTVNLEAEQICYIGGTCEMSLGQALMNFKFYSAALVEDEESSSLARLDEPPDEAASRMWVSVFPISDLAEPLRSAFIHHVERELLWRWVMRHGRMPFCMARQ